jgi:ATP-dependent helicase YprA (DUF1998 family)
MNPVQLAREIEERYIRYLKTTFYFKDKELRDSFVDELGAGHLRKGPYLEATPVFRRDQTPRALFPYLLGFQPDDGFLKAIHDDRPLYKHQAQAIGSALVGRNVVVATGTGSGKTEAFLFPILLHLYREFRSGTLGPGVRALILYPMNALANDQRDRLGEICKCLQSENSPFRFTFGQYIGETPEDENDTRRRARDLVADCENKGFRQVVSGRVTSGELVLRSEMRETPPNILLTNYSMLEYLLLRPDDSRLFDNGQAQSWTYLVLDEAHQYRGSRGIEMAMLLRRLKQRLVEGGRSKPFRCIATSATLAEGAEDKPAIAAFAGRLFGEEFLEQDIILGDQEPIAAPGPSRLLPVDYQLLAQHMNGTNEATEGRVAELADRLDVTVPVDSRPEILTGLLLQRDRRSAELRRLITTNPMEVAQVAEAVFDDLPPEDREPALSELVDLLLRSRDPVSDAPLLSARYHLFLKSLEGAFVSYWPKRRVLLDRKADRGELTAFEVALCRECGQHYLVGPKGFKGGNLASSEAIRDPSHVDFGAAFFRPIEGMAYQADEDEDGEADPKERLYLCVRCGQAGRTRPTCGHDSLIQVIREESQVDEDRADQMVKCSACGYSAAGRDPVREVVHGADGPHAVIATTLHQRLPPERRKVLAFSDSRQEAAFFAWYLQDSYADILSRNLILRAVQRTCNPRQQEEVNLQTLAARLSRQYPDSFRQKPSEDNATIRSRIWRALYREFLTDEQRISLAGVGLVQWSVQWPENFIVPSILRNPPWSLTEREARDLMLLLVDSMRADRAVEIRTDQEASLKWMDLGLRGSQMRFRIGPPGRPKGVQAWPVRSWDGADQRNRLRHSKRTELLEKLVGPCPSGEETLEQAVEALRAVWGTFQQSGGQFSRDDQLLVPVDDARRLNPDWWRLRPIDAQDTMFQCGVCGRVQAVSVRGICPRHGCPGKLTRKRAVDLEPNHYRLLYQDDIPRLLRVEEHTAQLDHDKAREFQRDFKAGRIHILSCSTTFELGVDLGDLDIIFLRNVPPEAFNYAQRVGRAGRRERPGFSVTYCRRGPHDLYHFADPKGMMSGKVRSPVLSLKNERINTRHMTAVALSRFFRQFPERFKGSQDRGSHVERLLQDMDNPSATADMRTFLGEHKAEMVHSLTRIVAADPEIIAQVGLANGTWIDRVAGDNSLFALAEAEISSDYRNVEALEAESSRNRRHPIAEWAQKRARTIAGEDVLSWLSRKAIIPKYGFPVDVVELDTHRIQGGQEAMQVSLQRDLSIAVAEFAPTSKLVANKKVWTSYGLKRVAGQAWERWWYAKCAAHNRFERKPYQKEATAPPFERCCDRMITGHQYIEPRFGFVTNLDKPMEPTTRPSRAFTTRPYFADFKDRMGESIPCGDISVTPVSPGYLVVLCEGRGGNGFYVCEQCGAGFRVRRRTHENPLGQACFGKLDRVSLGHEFVTDVLRLQFHPEYRGDVEPSWFAYSLAYALVEGAAEVLEVPSTDLSATVAYGAEERIPPIILYDNVPGGAGLVARLQEREVLRACLEAARDRVDGKCGCIKSCYGCLRNYRNQFAHQGLQREPVMGYLEALLSNWR